MTVAIFLLPLLLVFGFWLLLRRSAQKGAGGLASFGRAKARRVSPMTPKITFRDVAGVDEAVEDGRLRDEGQHHPHRRHQPPGHPRSALLRPGRFDRQIVVDRPDRKGRSKILEVHTRGKPLAKEINVDALAGQTPGFTGADLSNLVNEAALLSARNGKREITQVELEEGIMRVIAGPEKKTRVMSDKERLITAYTRWATRSSGTTSSTPIRSTRSRSSAAARPWATRSRCRRRTSSSPPRPSCTDNLAMTLGGRAAEEIVFSEITTGASNDLEKVTATASRWSCASA